MLPARVVYLWLCRHKKQETVTFLPLGEKAKKAKDNDRTARFLSKSHCIFDGTSTPRHVDRWKFADDVNKNVTLFLILDQISRLRIDPTVAIKSRRKTRPRRTKRT